MERRVKVKRKVVRVRIREERGLGVKITHL